MEEALAIIDAAIPGFTGRSMADTSEIIDVLLDLRQAIAKEEAE